MSLLPPRSVCGCCRRGLSVVAAVFLPPCVGPPLLPASYSTSLAPPPRRPTCAVVTTPPLAAYLSHDGGRSLRRQPWGVLDPCRRCHRRRRFRPLHCRHGVPRPLLPLPLPTPTPPQPPRRSPSTTLTQKISTPLPLWKSVLCSTEGGVALHNPSITSSIK